MSEDTKVRDIELTEKFLDGATKEALAEEYDLTSKSIKDILSRRAALNYLKERREEDVVAMYKGGATANEISAVTGISSSTVYNILNRRGIEKRTAKSTNATPSRIQAAARAYVAGELTVTEILRKYNMAQRTLYSYLREIGVEFRVHRGGPRKNASNHK